MQLHHFIAFIILCLFTDVKAHIFFGLVVQGDYNQGVACDLSVPD